MSNANIQQSAAINSDARKILCLAGAGTGKTFTMISRIVRLVNDGVDPKSILALTFTNAAAFEMKGRYSKQTASKRIPEFRTFHSFCYSVLATNAAVRNKLGYSSVPSIADEGTSKRFETEAQLMCGVHLTTKEMSAPVGSLDEQTAYKRSLIKKAASKLMRAAGYITFDILCYDICELFTNNDPIIQCYIDKYKYIFVDEFQDTDPRQWEFVQSFKDSSLFVVGDALQAIYSFRGADSSIIKSLSTNPEWTVYKLQDNYRSTTEICNYANKFSTYADPNYRVEIHSTKPGVRVIDCSDENRDRTLWSDNPCNKDRLSTFMDHFDRHEGNGAILVRTNSEVAAICNYLNEWEIPYVTGRPNSDAVNILKSAMDGQYMLDWLATFLNADKYAEYLKLESLNSGEEMSNMDRVKQFLQLYNKGKIAKYSEFIFAVRDILMHTIDPISKCEKILELLKISLNGIDLHSMCSLEFDNVELVDRLIAELEKQEECDLYVGTIHSSKGLEYDNVYVMNVNYRTFKLNSEDNKNLFYVAITRAKYTLVVA